LALDSSYGLEVPTTAQQQPADKPLQDPVEAMKQLVEASNKTLSQPSPSEAQSGRSASDSQPAFLDMGDTGGLYKSQVAKPAADASPQAPAADASPQAPSADAGTKDAAADAGTKPSPADTSPQPHTTEASAKTPVAERGHTAEAGAEEAASPKPIDWRGDGSGKIVPASEHIVAKGETLEGIARQSLGPQASAKEVHRYAQVMAGINGIEDPTKLQPGTKIDIPSHNKDGSIGFTNPDDKNERFSIHKDGTVEEHNKADGTSYTHNNVGKDGSYSEYHSGPKPEDNYSSDYDAKTHLTTKTTADDNGNPVVTDNSGYKKTTDSTGVVHETYSGDDQTKSADTTELTGDTVRHNRDGSTVTLSKTDHDTVAEDTDGTKTTKWADGTVKVQKTDDQGHETGYSRGPKAEGGYQEHGWGPTAKDNYDETYDPKTGTTIRQEGKGTPEEKTTTTWANGTTKVESKDGKNYQKNADGSEHHWGKENYDKPAYNYDNDKHLTDAKKDLNQQVKDHVPQEKQAAFKKDMDDFEARAKKDHLSPEEVAKTYDQMSKMLKAPEDKAVVSGKDRALLAEGLIHQVAHPEATKQGVDNTCNVTTVAENTLAKNPSKIAQMEAETALTGQWTAPDGKVIKIDSASLKPGAQESVYPPADPSSRSYATQVANLVMANDALQRRIPPESYVQRNPAFPGDTGERRLDASGKEISYQQYDAKGDTWRNQPDNSPGVTNHEIAAEGKRLNGKDYHLLSINDDTQGGVDNIRSAKDLQDKLLQLKQQGQLPVTIAVDGNHPPIASDPKDGYGPHVVTIDSYNEVDNTVHITNQWNPNDDHDVSVPALYQNAKREGVQN